MMTCQDALERLSAYLDGEASPTDRLDVDAHLQRCDHCRRELDVLLSIDADFRTKLAAVEPPPELFARVVQDLDRGRGHVAWWRLGWAAAGMTAMLLVGTIGYRQYDRYREEQAIVKQIDHYKPPERVSNVFSTARYKQNENPFDYGRSTARQNPFHVPPAGVQVQVVSNGGGR